MKFFKKVFNTYASLWACGKSGKKAIAKYLLGVGAMGVGIALTVNGSSDMTSTLLCDFFDKSIDRLDDEEKEDVYEAMDAETKKFKEKWS